MQLEPETAACWRAQGSTPIGSSSARYLGTEREPNYMAVRVGEIVWRFRAV